MLLQHASAAYEPPAALLGNQMQGNWTLGNPPVAKTISRPCVVTDGTRVERARFVPSGLVNEPPRWFGEDGSPLSWQPTHWRPAPAEVRAESLELD